MVLKLLDKKNREQHTIKKVENLILKMKKEQQHCSLHHIFRNCPGEEVCIVEGCKKVHWSGLNYDGSQK
jgi:hypothetical protein